MQSVPKILTFTLALLALMGAQVFGLQRGYVCLCTGELIETPASHCEDSEEGCGHEHEEEAPQEHAPLTVKHEAQGKAASTPQVQAPMLLAILDFAETLSAILDIRVGAETDMSRPPPGGEANPPASLLVAECKVLLV